MRPDDGDWQPLLEGRGARLVLPPRRLPMLRGIGTAFMAFGGFFGVAVLFAIGVYVLPSLTLSISGLVSLVVPLFVLFWLGAMFVIGLLVGYGHGELILTVDAVIGVERCGPMRYSRRVAMADIEHIEVRSGPWQDIATLQLTRRHSKPRKRFVWLLTGYSRARVETVAADVRAHIHRESAVELRAAEPAAVRIDLIDPIDGSVVLEQPAHSSAVIARTAEGLTIELQALGFFRGSKGLGSFSLIWLGLFGVVGPGVTVLFSEGESRHAIMPGLVSMLSIAIGVAFFVWALRSGKRRGIIQVAGGTLTIVKQALGAPVTYSWPRADLRRIALGSSATVNGRPLLELQVHSSKDGKVGLFVERSDDELEWIAKELSTALELER